MTDIDEIAEKLWQLRQNAARQRRRVTAYYLGYDEFMASRRAPINQVGFDVRPNGDGTLGMFWFNTPTFEVIAQTHVGASEEAL